MQNLSREVTISLIAPAIKNKMTALLGRKSLIAVALLLNLHVSHGLRHFFPRATVFAPAKSLSARDEHLARLLDVELSRGMENFARKQEKLGMAAQCMAS